MTWSSFHSESERYAAEAHRAHRLADLPRAQELFARAAAAEELALKQVSREKTRTLGIIAVSASALWYKSGDLQKAAQIAHEASAYREMPEFALSELRELLQVIWNEQAQRAAGLRFAPGQVLVSIKGGKVVTGGAPLDVIVDKVQAVQSLFYRTFEFMKALPLRKKGPPTRDIQDRCRPWLFQSVPGSYQFTVAIQEPAQQDMFRTDDPDPAVLTEKFLSILRAAGEHPEEGLHTLVEDDEYRKTFLKMARNLAPTGKSIDQIEIRGSGDGRPLILSPSSRKLISDTLRGPNELTEIESQPADTILRGVLRALDLEHDWIEVASDGELKRISGVGETVDDLIGPMVNKDVLVRVRRGKGRKLTFLDIEQED